MEGGGTELSWHLHICNAAYGYAYLVSASLCPSLHVRPGEDIQGAANGCGLPHANFIT